jgi:hypothetical protein
MVEIWSHYAQIMYTHRNINCTYMHTSCQLFIAVTTGEEFNTIRAANIWHQNVTCSVVRVTKMTGFGLEIGFISLLQ